MAMIIFSGTAWLATLSGTLPTVAARAGPPAAPLLRLEPPPGCRAAHCEGHAALLVLLHALLLHEHSPPADAAALLRPL